MNNKPTAASPLGLLLDVDGPIASPVTRRVDMPGILTDLVALVRAGVPIAFVTGRSDAFIREQLVVPLLDAGLGSALEHSAHGVFGVFEKGAAWAEISPDGLSAVQVDESVALPTEAVTAIRDLVATDFSDSMFFDDTKRAMISVEQRTDVDSPIYREAQMRFDERSFELIAELGIGIRHGERLHHDRAGAVPFRIDPTIISTDIESVTLDKDRGARRALDHFESLGALPSLWRTVGDSRSDYKMADQLHADGFDVAHVDVRPADGILDRPYRVLVQGELIHDEAGASFLDECVRALGLR